MSRAKEAKNAWVVKSVADMVRRKGLQRLMFESDQEPSILDLNSKVVAELGGSHDVIMEASPVNDKRTVLLNVQFRQLEARSELTS